MGPFDKNYFTFQLCGSCERTHYAYMPEGSNVYPIVDAECPFCGVHDCCQQGSPLITMN